MPRRVTGKQETHSKSTTYSLDYYFDGGGEWVNDTAHVSQLLYESTREGDTLQVTYLPSNPSVHRLGYIDAPRVTKHEMDWGMGVGAIAGLFTLLMVAAEYSYRQQMRLAVCGVPVVGKIVSCEPPVPGSKTQTYTVKYTFADLRGDTKTSVWNAPEARGKELQPDADVTVLCNIDNPNHFSVYMALDAVQVEGASPPTSAS